MNYQLLFVGLFGAVVILRAAVIGSLTPDGNGIRREDGPALFWVVLSFAILLDIVFFIFAFDVSLAGKILSAIR
ncbi:hypothetical protein NDN01_18015 [Sphingomonas sp. QA11]|uniref:hypothetical protein n=1 Tax=Sphingomonas sp. QA11 TaxID=2950605 RepID=UPI00234B3E82|nr:hypothetical protein [Sphingomonas sp. QA11]WCM25908.1 hypothetical protein NDN01_18015 [Sphingomonas sp. QA11]